MNSKEMNDAGEKKAAEVIGRVVSALTEKAKALGLDLGAITGDIGFNRFLCLYAVSTTSVTGYSHRIKIEMVRDGWKYTATGEVAILTEEPRPGRSYGTKTIRRKALTKDGELNTAPILRWLEEVAATKVRLALNQVEANIERERRNKVITKSVAIQTEEIPGKIPVGVAVTRMDADHGSHGLYKVSLNAEVGYFTIKDTLAILAIIRARKNS
jgi:hypothetical protein